MSPITEKAAQPAPSPRSRTRDAGEPRLLAVFDLDGTLVDTAPDLAASLNQCLAHAGIPPVTVETVRPHAGHGVRAMLERAYGDAGRPLDEATQAEQRDRFLAYYEAHIADHSKLFAGALDAMDRLEGDGFAMAICTNKVEALARTLLDALGLLARFDAVCGCDTFAGRKPDPVHLLGTIERAGGHPRHSVMIGDSQADVDAARACGVPTVLLAAGYGADEATRAAADVVIEAFDDLSPVLLRSILKQSRNLG